MTSDTPKLLRVPEHFKSVDEVLGAASMMHLDNVLVLSEREDGSLVFLTTDDTNFAECNWLLDKMKTLMLMPESYHRKDT